MQTKLYGLFIPAMLTCLTAKLAAQSANLELSNLSPVTAVNRTLLPKTDSASNLGSAALGWRNIYLANALYLKKRIAMQQVGTTNFFVGPLAGRTNATGTYNFGSGISSLFSLTSGSYNTAAGYESLWKNTSGQYNSAFGTRALWKSTTGSSNTAVGALALNASNGSFNVAVGAQAMLTSSTGDYNVAIGNLALSKNTGSNNIAIGSEALADNLSEGNIAVGNKALRSNGSGVHNVAIGDSALSSSGGAGDDNTAVGFHALASNANNTGNVAMGAYALANDIAPRNTGIGWYSLFSTISGEGNTATGNLTLYHNTSGEHNTANGGSALVNNSTGLANAGFGAFALSGNTTGKYNVGVGFYALRDNSDGSDNSALGAFTNIWQFVSNSTAIGAGSLATASNQVRIGNENITSIGGYVNWSNISDGRFKKNVTESVAGLAFINKLKPVVYNLDITGIQARFAEKRNSAKLKTVDGQEADKTQDPLRDSRMQQATAAKEKVRYSGFVAQDVEKAAKEVGYEFSGVDAPKNDKDLYGLRYADFVVPLVKSVQELSALNQELQQKLTETEARLDKLEALMKGNSSASGSGEIFLGQNTPNPFKGTTSISYTLPRQFSNAKLVLYDAAGKALKQWSLTGVGKGMVNIDAVSLASGAYSYSLVVDGRIAGSKKMILAR